MSIKIVIYELFKEGIVMSKKKNNKMSNALLVCISVTLVAIIAMIAVGAYGLNNRDTVSYDDDDMSSLVSDRAYD